MQKQTNNTRPTHNNSGKDKIKIDLIVIGNPNSGKTSLIKRYIQGESIIIDDFQILDSFSHFYTPTIGLNLQRKIIKIQQTQVTVCIWDTAGQQKFFSLTKNYFKKADGVLVIFDLTDRNSFERIQKYWIHEVKQNSDQNCTAILIGNKIDLQKERIIKIQQTQELQQKLQIKYFQTSARTGQNVQQAIEYVVKQCINKIKDNQPSGLEVDIRKQNNNQLNQGNSCLTGMKDVFTGVLDRFKK